MRITLSNGSFIDQPNQATPVTIDTVMNIADGTDGSIIATKQIVSKNPISASGPAGSYKWGASGQAHENHYNGS